MNSDFKASRSLSSDKIIYQEPQKIINKAIIYSGVNTGYTRSLIKELDTLKRRDHQSTALKHVLNFSDIKTKKSFGQPEIEILEMNDLQERAVEESLASSLTVVTGPPGTGKSWVVKNLIANCIHNNQTVLLASKNNKAVDVVVNDLKSVFGIDFIVRMGHREKRRNAFSEIENIIAKRKSLKVPNTKKLIEELKSVNSSICDVKNEKRSSMKKMSDLQNELETCQMKIDFSLDTIPEKLMGIYTDKYGKFENVLFEKDLQFFRYYDGILKEVIRRLLPWYYKRFVCQNFRKRKNKIPKKLLRYIDDFLDNDNQLYDCIQSMRGCFMELDKIHGTMEKRMDVFNEIQNIDPEDSFDAKIHELKKRKIELSKSIVKGLIIEKITAPSESEINHLTRYIDITKKLEEGFIDKDIWKNLSSEWEKEIFHAIKVLPVWVVTNLSVKSSFPLSGALFDLLIIDEASQNDIASTLPLLYRAKRAVIIGDPKQLRHVCTMNYIEDTKIAAKNNVKNFADFSYSKNSIYDISERVVRSCNQSPLLLNEHFRSHRDIIDYSNIYFYENKLKIKTRDMGLNVLRGIKWINIVGTTKSIGSSVNEEEANTVLDTLIKYSKSELRNRTFGVVTLFRAQAELIEEQIEKSGIRKVIDDITIGTAHTFQGDQKDIIIFSPGVSKGVSKRIMSWINSSNPELINVAVTRARRLLVIVGDIDKCREYDGPLKKLADYAEENEDELHFDSPAEEALFNGLEKIGIFVKPQYSVEVGSKFYRLDFALFKDSSKYDIEVDGDTHLERKEEDSLRNKHLRALGWKIWRYRARRINDDLEGVLEEIKRLC